MGTHLWTWGGTYFGQRDGDSLWTCKGRHVGRFHDDEVYGRDGKYLGEIKSDNRLITNKSKRSRRHGSFTPYGSRGSSRYGNCGGYGMYAGYEDFPDPESFH
jgi:hypothetical protein